MRFVRAILVPRTWDLAPVSLPDERRDLLARATRRRATRRIVMSVFQTGAESRVHPHRLAGTRSLPDSPSPFRFPLTRC
jgi:hypothetical protein